MKRFSLLILPLLLFSCSHSSLDTRRSSPPREKPAAGTASCQPLGESDRKRLLEIADPSNYPSTRYRSGPNLGLGIEKETDCSRFVHEIYKRAGLPYDFLPTAELRTAREFDLLPEKEAIPGDLMLFRGHVGIVADDGRIISALRTRHRRRKSSIETLDRSNFRTFRGRRYVLRYRCQPPPDEDRLPASARYETRPAAAIRSR